ncbi:MAG TPA: CDP-alcohol phosphatidyltransferase family protein [Bryobacteraceae bacterium]|nr:CDP-alcohol phosphatidyltransferase family protein [Bryobacteraceae bacterium]
MLRQLPSLLTLTRLAASPFLVWLVLNAEYRAALGLVLVAGLTDWFDGFTARKLGVAGRFGMILDPVADKTMLVALFVVTGVVGLLPGWLVGLVIARDFVIAIGALLLRVLRDIRRFPPSLLGKVSTFFQIVLVLLVLMHAAFPNAFFLWPELIALGLVTLFTTLSGIGYVRIGIQMARRPIAAKTVIDG